MKHQYSIEDCLEMLVGHTNAPGCSWKDRPFSLAQENRKVLYSIGTQVFRGKALTEKQHHLVKTLLVDWYTDQFDKVGINISRHVDILRSAYRIVDKSHWVKQTKQNDNTYISIRFPFNNQAIDHIASLKQVAGNSSQEDYTYKDHTHNFKYNELNVFKVTEIAKNFDKTEFEFDQIVLDDYETIKEFQDNKHSYIPGIYNFEYKNIPDKLESYLVDRYGQPCPDNITELWDKRRMYGLCHFDKFDQAQVSTLTQKLLDRNFANVQVRPSVWTTDQVFQSFMQMNRFPLLILISEEQAHSELCEIWQTLKGFIDPKDVSVTFRLDNQNNNEFNQFIRDKSLNNSVTENTKIVIASRKKISKPLLKSNWKPEALFTFGSSRFNGFVMNVFVDEIEFKVYYTQEDSLISNHRRAREQNYKLGIEIV